MSKNEKSINQVRVGAILSYLNMGIGSIIPMFYTPIMLSLLGQDEYGLYKLSSSVTSYLSLISLGIGSALVRYYTKYIANGDKEGEARIFGLFRIIYLVISIITILIGIVLTFSVGFFYKESVNNQEQLFKMQVIVLLLSITTAYNFFCSPYTALISSHEKFLFLQVINILTTIVTPLVNIVFLLMGFKSVGLAVSTLMMSFIIRVIYVLYVRKVIKLKPIYSDLPKHLVKEILVFSMWVFIANIVNQLYNTTDTLIIGAIPALATIGVAVYNIGLTFNTMMMNFSLGMLNVLTPKVNKLVFSNSSNTELTDLMIRIGRLQCYIVSLVCTGFISFGQPFILLWAGDGYQDAYWIAIVTMVPACIPLIQNIAMNIIIAKNKHRFRSLTLLFIAFINIVGTILCVNYFGIVGAAVVTGVANLLGTGFIMNWYYWKKIHLEIPRFWKSVVNIYIGPILMCAITLILSQFIDLYNWATLLMGIIIYFVIFVAYNWLFIMNDYEKNIFRDPIRKLTSKFSKKGDA